MDHRSRLKRLGSLCCLPSYGILAASGTLLGSLHLEPPSKLSAYARAAVRVPPDAGSRDPEAVLPMGAFDAPIAAQSNRTCPVRLRPRICGIALMPLSVGRICYSLKCRCLSDVNDVNVNDVNNEQPPTERANAECDVRRAAVSCNRRMRCPASLPLYQSCLTQRPRILCWEA